MHDKILIVDFGSQVTQLIARRVREQGVYCEPPDFVVSGNKRSLYPDADNYIDGKGSWTTTRFVAEVQGG